MAKVIRNDDGEEFIQVTDEDIENSPALVSFTVRVPWIELTEIGFQRSVSAQDVVRALQENWSDPAAALAAMNLLDDATLEVRIARQVAIGANMTVEIRPNNHATWPPAVSDEPRDDSRGAGS
jgi:hypothetical protein